MLIEGSAERTFECLADEGMTHLFSHEETGVLWTFERDKKVKIICRNRGVHWREFPTNGVVRGLKSRDRWQDHYQVRILSSPLGLPCESAALSPNLIEQLIYLEKGALRIFPWHLRIQSKIAKSASKCTLVQQRGGESIAHKLLQRFLQPKVHSSYVKSLSKPQEAQYFSSRLSPYLAFGCISSRQVVSQINLAKLSSQHFGRSLNAFQSRLAWRCHFMQKLENFSEMENSEQNSALKNLRAEMSSEEFERWSSGQTGVPLVDACLRSVHQTGFLNFRMRAMLMSFATHLMWRDWRAPSWDLARSFLDFEPGIHFSQVQMQAAVTGNNQIRIYNPLKQSLDQDPDAKFIRHWVPELRLLSTEEIHALQNFPRNYPKPIVDLDAAMISAREHLFKVFKSAAVRLEAKNVQEKLGSRGGSLSWRGRSSRGKTKRVQDIQSDQPTLFDDGEAYES
jgi:deoxyribodipyrimidine photo-lyase